MITVQQLNQASWSLPPASGRYVGETLTLKVPATHKFLPSVRSRKAAATEVSGIKTVTFKVEGYSKDGKDFRVRVAHEPVIVPAVPMPSVEQVVDSLADYLSKAAKTPDLNPYQVIAEVSRALLKAVDEIDAAKAASEAIE